MSFWRTTLAVLGGAAIEAAAAGAAEAIVRLVPGVGPVLGVVIRIAAPAVAAPGAVALHSLIQRPRAGSGSKPVSTSAPAPKIETQTPAAAGDNGMGEVVNLPLPGGSTGEQPSV